MCNIWSCERCDREYKTKHCSRSDCAHCCVNSVVILDQLCEFCCEICVPVCEEHGICFCIECMAGYKRGGFKSLNNKCFHESSQCVVVNTSKKYITRGDFIVNAHNLPA